MLKVCPWCALVLASDLPQPDCPQCLAEGHRYRMIDEGEHGITWLRERWQARGYQAGLARLQLAEQALHAAQEVPDGG